MPRIIGRKILPSDLSERRVLMGLGVHYLRAPRSVNPYMVARKLKRAAHPTDDVLVLSDIARSTMLSRRLPSTLAGPDSAALMGPLEDPCRESDDDGFAR